MTTFLEEIAQSGIHILVVVRPGDVAANINLALIDVINKTYTHCCQFFIVSPINNQKWMGLESVKNEYELNNEIGASPAVVYPFGAIDAPQAIEQIKIVYQILMQRSENGVTRNDADITLILKEWHSLYQAFKQASKETCESVMSMLAEIMKRGREFKIRLILESASINVADLGFSIEARKQSFTTVVVERIEKKNQAQLILQVLENPWFHNLGDKAHLKSFLDDVCAGATEEYQFVALSDFGKGAVEVLPDLSQLRNIVIFGQ